MEQNFERFCERFLELRRARVPMVVATLLGERGHAPQDAGARIILGQDGILFGTIGGGKIEKKCMDHARELLGSSVPEPRLMQWNLQRDVGMSCGGEVSVFFEVFSPASEWKIAVFGAGHIAQELVPILMKLDCRLQVFDPREDWVSKLPSGPALEKRVCADMPAELKKLPGDAFVVLVTMGHSTDFPILRAALERGSFPYLGVLGSRVKRIKMDAELRELGFSEDQIKSYECPMGEDYGKNTPPEIAISIAASLLRSRQAHFQERVRK